MLNQGAFFSRPYGNWADLVYSRDAASKKMLKNIKHIFDPDNVLNPGKLCFQIEKVPGRERK
jgi:glycolate oxidase